MQRAIDSKIQARVRILLARRWVDLRSVTVGTTNGVVYIGGRLRSSGGPTSSAGSAEVLPKLKREISRIPDVRDVVFQLQGNKPGEGA